MVSSKGPEQDVFESIDKKDLDRLKQIIREHPDLDLNCVDKDELTPLQHACHSGEIEVARFLINNGADVNLTKRKDGYTALMFAAISNKQDIVRLLLERGVDITTENCVNRTASQMAAFIGLFKIVHIINSWIPYDKSVEPYTRRRELEDEARIPSMNLGRLLHEYIVLPSLHPVKYLLFIKDNLNMISYGSRFIYVLENLCSKSSKPPSIEETLSLKYYYLSYILQHCLNQYMSCRPKDDNPETSLDKQVCMKGIDAIIRRLIRRHNLDEIQPTTPQLNRFILECAMKFPYTHLGIFKTMSFAMSKESSEHYQIFTQSLNGPHMFGRAAEACSICTEVDKCRKCSKCKTVYYCGPQCQLIDWFQHKKVCKNPEEQALLKDTDDNHHDEE